MLSLSKTVIVVIAIIGLCPICVCAIQILIKAWSDNESSYEYQEYGTRDDAGVVYGQSRTLSKTSVGAAILVLLGAIVVVCAASTLYKVDSEQFHKSPITVGELQQHLQNLINDAMSDYEFRIEFQSPQVASTISLSNSGNNLLASVGSELDETERAALMADLRGYFSGSPVDPHFGDNFCDAKLDFTPEDLIQFCVSFYKDGIGLSENDEVVFVTFTR